MSNFTHVIFEGLGLEFDLPSVAFSVFGYEIHWYGLIIAFGFALAVLYGGRMAYKWKMSLDGMTDVLIWGTLFGIICARAYYVIFEWGYYSQHLSEIPAIWNGGIAIYGGIIGAIIGAAIGCKTGKINFLNLLDLGALGLLIGQGIGRWGNFFNQEAFGTNTSTALFRMWSPKIQQTLEMSAQALSEKGIEVDPMMPVHPTFLYESVWCLLSFVILHIVVTKFRKFKGEIFMLYGVLYGAERMIVEGMRTDSLYIGNTTIRVSQLLSAIIVVVALSFLIYFAVKCRQNRLPKALVLDDLDALEDVNKKAKEERLAKKQAKKEVKENNKNANN
ncbi:MAG: prolipoprotein diacylglyceryl transferase [Eubacterium sp.]